MEFSQTKSYCQMKILITLSLLVFASIGFSQSTASLLYNEHGQLKADTSFSISQSQLKAWKGVENLFIKELISDVQYSTFAKENDLSGLSIISFDLDSTKQLKNFKIIKQVGGGLEECLKIFIKSFKYLNTLAPTDKDSLTYYISVDFELVDAAKTMVKTHAIPVATVKFDYIQY